MNTTCEYEFDLPNYGSLSFSFLAAMNSILDGIALVSMSNRIRQARVRWDLRLGNACDNKTATARVSRTLSFVFVALCRLNGKLVDSRWASSVTSTRAAEMMERCLWYSISAGRLLGLGGWKKSCYQRGSQ